MLTESYYSMTTIIITCTAFNSHGNRHITVRFISPIVLSPSLGEFVLAAATLSLRSPSLAFICRVTLEAQKFGGGRLRYFPRGISLFRSPLSLPLRLQVDTSLGINSASLQSRRLHFPLWPQYQSISQVWATIYCFTTTSLTKGNYRFDQCL